MRKIIFSIILSCILIFSVIAFKVSANCNIVKVGYFEFNGYHNISKNGEKSGYGYEYLQELKKYANWKYEYVYESFEECLKLLEEGKIDLLTSASYSESRDEIFDYSESSMGIKSFILTVKSSNKKYVSGEYDSFNGIHVGMLSNNTSNTKFEEFSKKNNFSYTYDDSFSDASELYAALQEGKVEAIVTSNLRKTVNERVIAEFTSSPYYAIVKGGNKELLYELNMAMEKINIASPTFQPTLYQKYYGVDSMEGIAFSSEELEYIKNNPELTILIPPSLQPMAYSKNGIAKGIEPELIKKSLEPSGLKLNFILFNSSAEYAKAIENTTKYPVTGLAYNDPYQAESINVRLTSPYLTISYNIIKKENTKSKKNIIAAVKNEPIVLNYVEKHYDKNQIKYYDNGNECIQAIIDGEATYTIMNSYIADYIIENDVINQLTSNTLMGFSSEFMMSVSNDADFMLFSIINKCVNGLSQDLSRSIIAENTLYREKSISIIEYLYMNPASVIILVIIFSAILIFIIVIITRHTRMKKEQRAYEETEQFAKIATEANGEIIELNLENRLVTLYSFINKKLVKKVSTIPTNYCDEKIHSEIIHPDNFPEYAKMFSNESLFAIAGRDLQMSYNLRMKEADGKYYWMLFTLQGIPVDSSHPKNLMILKKNIDDIKREEALREQQLTDALNTAMAASAAKGTFMSRMSHEIRTPLNAVIGYMTIAKNNAKNIDKVKDCINKAEIAAKHLLSIINDVLDMSSIESGKLKISHVSFNFKELISDISSVFYMQAQSKNIKFEVIVTEVSEELLIGDKLRVNQIIFNLLSNAMKFTPPDGTIYFTVKQTAIKNDKIFIKFIVADNGIGMTEEYMAKLFTPFEQQDASISQKYGGTGLGLSITKNLITMMNGVIEVESEQNKGSTFSVELPFERDFSLEKPNKIRQDFSHINVLIVDDELSTCKYINILMKRIGVQSKYVLTGKDAVEAIVNSRNAGNAFDMCLMDLKMPDMDGIETTKQIRECVGNDMPIIIITSYDFSEIEETAKSAGVSQFISKPIFQSTVLDMLVNIYGKYNVNHIEQTEELYNFKGKRLLLAEDNEMNREIAVDILTQYGFEVDCAENGKEALNIFEKSENGVYSGILMDIQMPIMNGYDATKAIRELSHPQAKSIPIIAMTANAFTEDIVASLSAGMNDHISKPIDVDQMLLILKKHI